MPVTSPAQRLRSIFSGSIGNLVEWYDWYAYAAFSLYFAKAFFPADDPTAQLLNTAAVFALGFLMRPLGGWLMGLYADRHGRRRALMMSVLLMCAGSLLIALTPGYAQIGVAAPALLVFARMLQGISVGAATPICAYPGVSAMISDPAHISRTEAISALRRPWRSA